MVEQAEKEDENKNAASEQLPEGISGALEVETLKAEVAALKDRMLRIAADAENTRKRAQRDVEEGAKYAITSMARDLVAVAENLKRALDSIPESQPQLRQGVELTYKGLLNVFEKHGIRRIDPMGEKFDHNFHQAVLQVESAEHEAGTIVQVVQAGYKIHDRLLQPAMVGVAKQGETAKQVDTTA